MLQFTGHTDTVYDLAYSPDGRLLASGSADTTARVWDLATRQTIHTLAGHSGTVWRVAFAGQGCTVVIGCFDGYVRVWADSVYDPYRYTLRVGDREVRALTTTRDGRSIFCSGWQETVYESGRCAATHFNSLTGKLRYEIPTWPLEDYDGPLEVSPGRGRQMTKRIPRRAPTYRLFPPGIIALAVSPESRWLALAAEMRPPCHVLLWDLREERYAMVLAEEQPPRAMTFLPGDGTSAPLLACAVGSKVHLWDIPAAAVRAALEGHDDWLWDIAASADGRTLLTAGRDGLVKCWDIATAREVASWNWGIGAVWTVAVAPDGMTAACGGDGGRIVVWDLDA